MNARERQLAIYASEEAALGGAGREFGRLGEVRAYVDALIASDWWAARWPHIEAIAVGRSAATASAASPSRRRRDPAVGGGGREASEPT